MVSLDTSVLELGVHFVNRSVPDLPDQEAGELSGWNMLSHLATSGRHSRNRLDYVEQSVVARRSCPSDTHCIEAEGCGFRLLPERIDREADAPGIRRRRRDLEALAKQLVAAFVFGPGTNVVREWIHRL